jgi:holo-[acyl-carrier protein] synthase
MATASHAQPRVGIDLVQISRIEESLQRFGDRFLKRLFHVDEIAYARSSPMLCAQRLAARFAAKEAALKVLQCPHRGIPWREIEVRRSSSGECALVLHGAANAAAREAGVAVTSLSLTHEGDYALAVVLAQHSSPND